MLSLLEPLRRFKPIDAFVVRLEPYRAAVDWGVWVFTLLGAGVMAAVQYFTESRLPLAILVGLGTIVVLCFLPAAFRQLWARSSAPKAHPQAALARSQPTTDSEVSHDLLHLLDVSVYQTTLVMLSHLVAQVPPISIR